jgi:hypothetical protein
MYMNAYTIIRVITTLSNTIFVFSGIGAGASSTVTLSITGPETLLFFSLM